VLSRIIMTDTNLSPFVDSVYGWL